MRAGPQRRRMRTLMSDARYGWGSGVGCGEAVRSGQPYRPRRARGSGWPTAGPWWARPGSVRLPAAAAIRPRRRSGPVAGGRSRSGVHCGGPCGDFLALKMTMAGCTGWILCTRPWCRLWSAACGELRLAGGAARLALAAAATMAFASYGSALASRLRVMARAWARAALRSRIAASGHTIRGASARRACRSAVPSAARKAGRPNSARQLCESGPRFTVSKPNRS